MLKEPLIAVLVVMLAAPGLAQSGKDFTPPPLVPAAPPPMPAPEPGVPPPALPGATTTSQQPGTPPPPANAPPPTYVPGTQPSYLPGQYSPYGTPPSREKPGPEIGLMVTESLFGILTAASSIFLPYLLLSLLSNPNQGGFFDPLVMGIVTVGTIALAPLAVAQAQVGIANGSSYYMIDSWIPMVTGLLGAGLVVLTYFFINGQSFQTQNVIYPTTDIITGQPSPAIGPTLYLLIASSVAVPLLSMVAINLFKQPKLRAYGVNYQPGEGFTLGVPTPAPILAQTTAGTSVGMGFSLLNMRF